MRQIGDRFGGPAGNQALTSATALVLTLLLGAEGITIVDLGGLRSAHMFIGLLLLGPVLVKLGSTGYRFVRYYAGAAAYRRKGPPGLPLRLLAPLLVIATVVVFATGVALLALGRRSDTLVEVHKVSFIVWGAAFGIHFLAHLPRMARSIRADWTPAARRRTAGAGPRLWVIAGSVLVAALAALALLSAITGWNSEQI